MAAHLVFGPATTSSTTPRRSYSLRGIRERDLGQVSYKLEPVAWLEQPGPNWRMLGLIAHITPGGSLDGAVIDYGGAMRVAGGVNCGDARFAPVYSQPTATRPVTAALGSWLGVYRGEWSIKVEGDAMDVSATLVVLPTGEARLSYLRMGHPHDVTSPYKIRGDTLTATFEDELGEERRCKIVRRAGKLWGLGPCMNGTSDYAQDDPMPLAFTAPASGL